MENQIFELQYAIDTFYFLVCGALVMWMAAGFSMLEAGMVRAKNTTEISVSRGVQIRGENENGIFPRKKSIKKFVFEKKGLLVGILVKIQLHASWADSPSYRFDHLYVF